MSNAQENHTEEHQAVIKTPKQLITVVVLAFIVPVVIILLLVNYVTNQTRVGAGSDSLTPAAIDARIAPVAGFELVDADAPRVFLTGEAVYQQVCAACHTAGVAGAPATGDNAAWAPRIATGLEAMVRATIDGKGAMPPKGGATNLSDFEIERAVVYLANASGGNFAEPEEPAALAEGDAVDAAELPEEATPAVADVSEPEPPAAPETVAEATTEAPVPAPAPADTETQEPQVTVAEPAEAPTAVEPETTTAAIQISPEAGTVGKQLYDTACMACHAAGVAGAPKTGDAADWAPLIETGMPAMLQAVIQGKGAMPPRGGAANASDDQLRAAIEYMIADAL